MGKNNRPKCDLSNHLLFLAKRSAPMCDVRGHYDVPDGDQASGVEDTAWYRAGNG